MKTNISFMLAKSILMANLFCKKTPLFVSWAVTNRCNSRCKYCAIWDSDVQELTTQEAILLLGQLKKQGTVRINFTGGEPLLRQDIGCIIDHAYKLGMKLTMNSNGILFPERAGELKNLSAIRLSLDGPEETNDFIRGSGSFRKTMAAIKIAKSKNIKVVINTVLSMRNLDCIDYLLKITGEFNAVIGFQPATLRLLGGVDDNKLSVPVDKLRDVVKKLIFLKKEKNGRLIYNSLSGLKHLYFWPDMEYKMRCGGGLIFCRINADGTLALCGRAKETKKHSCINLGFQEAFNRLSPDSCGGCWCSGVIEANLLLLLKPDVILNLMRVDSIN